MAERYYSLVREIIHTYDPRSLVLGDRYQSSILAAILVGLLSQQRQAVFQDADTFEAVPGAGGVAGADRG